MKMKNVKATNWNLQWTAWVVIEDTINYNTVYIIHKVYS